MIITGEITAKEEKPGKTALGKAYTRVVYTINDKIYSTFNAEIYNKFMKGDFVKIELKENKAGFLDMISMETAERGTPITEKVSQNGSKGEIHLTIESVRSNALNSAIEWRKILKLEEQEKIDLFTAAKKFEDYILNGVKEK